METDDSSLDDLVFSYTDEEAVDDGILIPFTTRRGDTGHRLTTNAYTELSQYHRQHGCADYDDAALLRFFFNELLPLVGTAHETYRHAGILRTDYKFSVINKQQAETLWYLPNEKGGITMMLPSDY